MQIMAQDREDHFVAAKTGGRHLKAIAIPQLAASERHRNRPRDLDGPRNRILLGQFMQSPHRGEIVANGRFRDNRTLRSGDESAAASKKPTKTAAKPKVPPESRR